MRIWELLLVVVILAGIALIPAIFNLSIVQYATGIVAVIAIMIAIAFFVIKTGSYQITDEAREEARKDETPITKWQKCEQSIRLSMMRLYNTCSSVGFILFLCILLIIGIGIFDSLMSKNNEVGNKCECIQHTEMQKKASYHKDSIPQVQSDTIR